MNTLILFAAAALTSGGYTVTPNPCPSCPYRMRIAPDGRHAFINTSKVGEAEYPAMASRALELMKKAADTSRGGLARPLMGWSSWNTFGLNISDEIIVSVARAMATNGLKAAGYAYVNIDDGFFNGHDPKTGVLRWNYTRFPRGMKPVVDEIHALGLKAGTYSDAGRDTCGSIWGGDTPGRGAGLYGHDTADCQLHFKDIGFDFIKVDYCGGTALELDERDRYSEIAAAIRATGREVRFNMCRWAFPGVWGADIAESWRTTGDIRANWPSVRDIIAENLYLSPYARLGHYNDMDMLQVGRYVGEVKNPICKEDTGLTYVEEVTHFGMWCMLSSPLLIGCDVRALPLSTKELVTNPFLLAMNQNDLGVQGYVARREGEAYVLTKDADTRFGTARFVALYNAGDEVRDFKVPFADLDLEGPVQTFDLVERADVGVFERFLTASVPAHGTRFYRLDAARRVDRRVYEAETAFLPHYQELTDALKAGTPVYRQDARASGGVVVANLGGVRGNDLVWKDVRVSKPGRYRLEIRLIADRCAEMSVQVDRGEVVRQQVPETKGTVGSVAFERDLAAGEHEVRLFCKDRLPAIDVLNVTSVK